MTGMAHHKKNINFVAGERNVSWKNMAEGQGDGNILSQNTDGKLQMTRREPVQGHKLN